MLIFDPIYNGYFQLLGQNLENFCWGLEQIMYMQGINVLSENLLLEILKVLPSWIIERTSGWNSQQFCICWFFSLYIASKLYIYWNNLVVCGSHPFWVGSKFFSRPNLVFCETHPRRPVRSALLPLQACPSPDFSTFFRLRPLLAPWCRIVRLPLQFSWFGSGGFFGCLSVPRCQDPVVVILVISPPFSLQSECEVEVKIDHGILYNDKSLNLLSITKPPIRK